MITKEQVVQLAREAGAVVEAGLAPVFSSHAELHQFAKLIGNQKIEDAAARFEDLHLYGTKTADTKGVAAILRNMKDKP